MTAGALPTEHPIPAPAALLAGDARELLSAAFAQAPVGMAIIALDGRWLLVNPAACRVLGRSEAELLAVTLRDVVHPEEADIDRAQLSALLAGRIDAYEVNKRCLAGDGGTVWCNVRVSLVRGAGGGPRAVIVQIVDVTARREAELETVRERDQARAIIAAMPEGCCLTVDGELAAANDAFCEMVGYEESEIVGLHPPYPFWPPETAAELTALRRALRDSDGACVKTVHRHRDGTRFEVEITAQAARDPRGERLGFVHVIRDVTDNVRRHRELERRARTDALTGLPNRAALEEALRDAAERRTTPAQRLALVLLDLDNFKEINDAHGHPAGDAVLVEVAERLTRSVRRGEVLVRLGGEEFAWLLPEAGLPEAVAAADRARDAVGSRPFHGVGALTMSAGVGVLEAPCDAATLYALADRALYEAKQQGRDRTRAADAGAGAGQAGAAAA